MADLRALLASLGAAGAAASAGVALHRMAEEERAVAGLRSRLAASSPSADEAPAPEASAA
ncbi:MAG: hypothetical protein M3503_01875 [Actinomycetota bacterium]|nr:hypothetical protein [Actinomycetota bacterium]